MLQPRARRSLGVAARLAAVMVVTGLVALSYATTGTLGLSAGLSALAGAVGSRAGGRAGRGDGRGGALSALEALHAEVDNFHAKALTAEQRAAIAFAEGSEETAGGEAGGAGGDGGGWAPLDLEAELDRGTDPQILRDLGPWAGRGFTYGELIRTKRGRTPVGLAPALDPARPRPLFNAYVLAGRMYFSRWEAEKATASYYYPSLRKIIAFYELLQGVLEEAPPGGVPDALLVWHLDPYPLLGGKPTGYAGSVMVPAGGTEDPEMAGPMSVLPPLELEQQQSGGGGGGSPSSAPPAPRGGRPRDGKRTRGGNGRALGAAAGGAGGASAPLLPATAGAPLPAGSWARALARKRKGGKGKKPKGDGKGKGKRGRRGDDEEEGASPSPPSHACAAATGGPLAASSCTESPSPSVTPSPTPRWEAVAAMPEELVNDTAQPATLAGFAPLRLGVQPRNASTWVVPPAPEGLAPLLSLCKTDAHWDVLYPNMYFKTPPEWRRMTREIFLASRLAPWASRVDRVWWRGSMGDMWPGGKPRAVTVGAYHEAEWADFAFTENATRWEQVYNTWARRAPWGRSLPPGLATARHGGNHSMPMTLVAGYRHALHLPGFFMATYSRTLQFLMWSGAAVFVYDCPFYEFYYHRLRPWAHFIPVNATNLPARVAWARAHPQLAGRVAQRASRFARRYLTGDRVTGYWLDLLRVYARLQRFRPLEVLQARGGLPSLCTCWRLPRRGPGRPPDWVLPNVTHCGLLCTWRQLATDAAYRKPLFATGAAPAGNATPPAGGEEGDGPDEEEEDEEGDDDDGEGGGDELDEGEDEDGDGDDSEGGEDEDARGNTRGGGR